MNTNTNIIYQKFNFFLLYANDNQRQYLWKNILYYLPECANYNNLNRAIITPFLNIDTRLFFINRFLYEIQINSDYYLLSDRINIILLKLLEHSIENINIFN